MIRFLAPAVLLSMVVIAAAQQLNVYPPIPIPIPQSMLQQPQGSNASGLPACNAGAEGTIRFVNDALTPAALAAVVGGGAVHVGVMCLNGSWIVL